MSHSTGEPVQKTGRGRAGSELGAGGGAVSEILSGGESARSLRPGLRVLKGNQ